MRKYLFFAVLAAALVLGGCANNGGDTGTNLNTFLGGTQGVSLSFDTETPPAEVNIGDEFPITLVLENQGEYTVPPEDYFVRVMGISPEEFGTTADELLVSGVDVDESLQAKEMNPDTGETIDSYPVYIDVPQDCAGGDVCYLSYDGGIAGNTQFNFAADICYTYQTTANGKLCIKQELTRSKDDKVCTVSGPQAITSSGAPVQITGLQEFAGGKDSVRFSFTVMKAANGGDLSGPGSECSNANSEEDRVHITVSTGIEGLNCNGFVGDREGSGSDMVSGDIRLTGGSRQVTCTQDLTGRHSTDYEKVIEITAKYDYEQSTSTQVLVKNVE